MNRLEVREVEIPANGATLAGELRVPGAACGIVLFAHGSGSGRHSPRNRYVAERLNEVRLATLLMDLLTEAEEDADRLDAHLRFDVGMLADRLAAATEWIAAQSDLRGLPLGYFGASTGAAAALAASLRSPTSVRAIVSRGGRPDLAGDALPSVTAATLLLVGSLDLSVIELNENAMDRMTCEKRMVVVHGASHLFEERGKLEEVALHARAFFLKHLCP